MFLQGVVVLALVGCSSPTSARGGRIATYECAGGKAFTVRRDAKVAMVEYDDQSYRLDRRTSSMGVKYSSDEASLIIDGDLAVFVAETVLDLKLCRDHRA